jgi:hypothetical protein
MEAIGLASGLLAFITVATKIVHGAFELKETVSGAREEHVHISAGLNDLQLCTEALDSSLDSKADAELLTISKACQDLSRELLLELKKLDKGPGTWQKVSSTWAILRKQKTVQSMETRLDRYRSQIQLRLQFLIL